MKIEKVDLNRDYSPLTICELMTKINEIISHINKEWEDKQWIDRLVDKISKEWLLLDDWNDYRPDLKQIIEENCPLYK